MNISKLRAGKPAALPAAAEATATADPLLACLEYLARRYGKPFSPAAALAGLPLKGAKLSIDLLPRAAHRLGLLARLVKRRPSRVPALVRPFIVLFEDGDAAVVIGERDNGGRAVIVVPAVSPDPRIVAQAWLDSQASGYCVYLTADVEAADAAEPGAAPGEPRGHWFWSAVRRFAPSWGQIVLAAMLINLLGLAVPLFVMNVYDRVIPNLAIPTLWALAAGVALALLFDFLLKQLRTVVLDRTGTRVDMNVAASLFEQSLAIAMKARRGSAGALANQIREFETVRDFFTSSGILAVTDLFFIGIFIFVIWLLVGPIAYVPLLAVPLVLGGTLLAQLPLARSTRRAQAQGSRRHAILIESLIGIESIKAAAAEGVMQRKWEDAVAATARASSQARFWSALAVGFTMLVQQVVGVVIIIWGVFLVAEGDITIGGLIATSILGGRVLAPLGGIAATLARAQQAFAAMREISKLMKLPREGHGRLAGERHVQEGTVEFREASFSYPDASTPALSEISLKIRPGERVGIVGRIGSGKTTLGKLIAGLYLPQQGSVLVGDGDTRAYEPADLRAGVGYVPQEPELFAGTLRDNIVLGRPHAGEEEVAKVARIAGIDAFTAAHPLGLGLPIGERGRGLSGGQRQAVALARMLLREPKILFLDEPSSAMDTSSEAQLVRELGAWAGPERTLIVSTHRGSFLHLVERLIVLEAGRVVADGPKEAVLDALKAQGRRGAAAAATAAPAAAGAAE